MSCLAELPELLGFFSYSREDDDDFKGALSSLRDRVRRNLRAQLGRSGPGFKLFQDTEAIAHGDQWEKEIKEAVAKSVFFIPIITPTAIKSPHCKKEFELFCMREAELGRDDLIFPILYIRVPALEDEARRSQDSVLKMIHGRQYADWTRLRLQNVDTFEFGKNIEEFCQDIAEKLLRPWMSPEERRAEEERRNKEEQARAEQEELRRADAEAVRQANESRRRREEKQRRIEEAEARPKAEDALRKAGLEAAIRPSAGIESKKRESDLDGVLALALAGGALCLVLGIVGFFTKPSFEALIMVGIGAGALLWIGSRLRSRQRATPGITGPD
jgi:hypothetical protein